MTGTTTQLSTNQIRMQFAEAMNAIVVRNIESEMHALTGTTASATRTLDRIAVIEQQIATAVSNAQFFTDHFYMLVGQLYGAEQYLNERTGAS